jgi:hypothetical protein
MDDGRRTTDDGRRRTNGELACAVALQAAMERLRAAPLADGTTLDLSLKAAVVVGDGRRFVVGDHDHYRLDILAGRITSPAPPPPNSWPGRARLLWMKRPRRLCRRLTAAKWRVDEATGERFAVVQPAAAIPPPRRAARFCPIYQPSALRGWLHPGVCRADAR